MAGTPDSDFGGREEGIFPYDSLVITKYDPGFLRKFISATKPPPLFSMETVIPRDISNFF